MRAMRDKPTADERWMYRDAEALDACLRKLGCEPEQSKRVSAVVAAAIWTGPIGERVAALGRVRRWAKARATTEETDHDRR